MILVVIWLGYEQWNSTVSIYMLENKQTVTKYSSLFTISTFEILLLQPMFNKFFRNTYNNEKLRVLLGLLCFGGAYLILVVANSYWQFILGITLISIGDILALTSIPSLLNRYAIDGNRATIQSIASTAASFGCSIGPVFDSFLILRLCF